MQTSRQQIHPPPARVFHDSLDWRFLLPTTEAGKIRVVVEQGADFGQTLEQIGIPVSNCSSFSDIKQNEKENTQALVLPFGLPVRWVSAQRGDQIEFYRSLRHLVCPGGYLLIGFENSWNSHSKTQSGYHPSTSRRVANQLNRAGFRSIRIWGAMPNLRIPEYIFALNDRAIYFALQHRFRRKPALLNILRTLSYAIGWSGISAFLPGYFAVAVV
ncbi:MAG TPA: hypothetical protein VK206_08905 [Anaerolineales bacterium]|nr:hypothetical protein [Anaerolineales bacterium]HLO28644.1 hypothetical protein [Anaerolineales bacterium]